MEDHTVCFEAYAQLKINIKQSKIRKQEQQCLCAVESSLALLKVAHGIEASSFMQMMRPRDEKTFTRHSASRTMFSLRTKLLDCAAVHFLCQTSN